MSNMTREEVEERKAALELIEQLRSGIDRLNGELAAAKQAQLDAEKVRRLLREVMDWHADPDNESYSECEKIMCGWCEQAADILAKLG